MRNGLLSQHARTCVAVAFLTTVAAEARADSRSVDARIREARVQCATGEYQAGVRILAEVFALNSDANLVYNQGRCYEQNGKNVQAILRFEEYLRIAPKLAPKEVLEVRNRIAELRAQVNPGAALAQPAPAVAPAPIPVAAPIPLPLPAPAPMERAPEWVVQQPVPQPPPSRPVLKSWWFWTSVGVVVVGGVVAALALQPKSGAHSPACKDGVPCVP